MLPAGGRVTSGPLPAAAVDRLPGPMPVHYERRGAASVITIDRQERRNAVDGRTADELAQAYERFLDDDDARVLVLTGAGDIAFCAGADLKAIDTFAPRLMADGGPLGFTRRISPKPTIAAISGWCLAGGMELALWCDLRIAAEGSTLGFTERRFGVPLIDGGTQRLPRIVGLGRALDIILTGRLVPAEEALAIGLLTQIVPSGRHLDRALEIAEALANFPQETMLADRRAAIEGIGMTFEEGLRFESSAALEVFEAAQRGAARFAAGEGRGGAGAGA
ncbi:MAG: enoyl-CoA hydratase [Thermoleophilaceae bacterium]|nr:enoyl-CoA hydratase [Thermoleophilaceae bacterium]